MALFGMFKHTKHQKFEYKPRFYDEQKERVEEVKAKYSTEHSGNTELSKSRLRKGFRRRFEGEREVVKSSNRKANTRVLIILVILIVWFAYLIMKYLPNIVRLLS